MSSKKKRRGTGRPERRLSVRGVRRDPPDAKKISQALVALAIARAEQEAQAAHEQTTDRGRREHR
jgi:hypothetical protein